MIQELPEKIEMYLKAPTINVPLSRFSYEIFYAFHKTYALVWCMRFFMHFLKHCFNIIFAFCFISCWRLDQVQPLPRPSRCQAWLWLRPLHLGQPTTLYTGSLRTVRDLPLQDHAGSRYVQEGWTLYLQIVQTVAGCPQWTQDLIPRL